MPAWRNPKWTKEKQQWFMGLVEALCSKPDQANIHTIYGLFDLEVAITVAPEDEHSFTAVALERLCEQVSKEVDVVRPVIYVEGKQSREIDDLIDQAQRDI